MHIYIYIHTKIHTPISHTYTCIQSREPNLNTQEKSKFEMDAMNRASEAMRLAADADEAERVRGTSTLAQK